MSKPTDVRVVGAEVYFLPIKARMPLKFGAEVVEAVTGSRVRVAVADSSGRCAVGWGETPLSVTWAWPSKMTYGDRDEAMMSFCRMLAEGWVGFEDTGHPIELGHGFQHQVMSKLLKKFNSRRSKSGQTEPMPHLAAMICCSAFDIAVHDAYGMLHQRDVYEMYTAEFMNRDLSAYLTPADDAGVDFAGKYPADFFVSSPPKRMPVWHLVGGVDPLDKDELTGKEPDDAYPVTLVDWIRTDGLKCLKVKLRGNDAAWDYDRLVKVGQIAVANDVDWLTSDFNCLVQAPAYVNDILDKLVLEHQRIYGMILYVEQPFPYDMEANRIDVRSVSARKPLFMDESAHDWSFVRLGRELGWSGVALKTCKTQSGALLSACWAKAHGMTLMVQDLTNPSLAQIPHVRLAAYVGTIMGVETNSMQFWPAASDQEAKVHPGIYRRRGGCVDLSTINGPGFGYRVDEIDRQLPPPAGSAGRFE